MRNISFIISALLFSLLFQGSFPALAARDVVSAVEIQGNRKIESAAVKQKLKTQVNGTFSKELITSDIRTLFSLGFFEDVSVFEEETSDGLKIIFKVKEKPTIAKIEFEGLESIEKDELKDLILIKEYELLNRQKVNESVEKITQKYEEKGYYLADVSYEIKPLPESSDVSILFKAQENDKITVKKVNIIGNKMISSDDLKRVMQTREGGAFSWLTGSGSYREVVFERDIAAQIGRAHV